MGKKIKAKLKQYCTLEQNFTQVANTMLSYIKDPYAFKIYFYLCMRYNDIYDYAFPSLTTIAKDCQISLKKVKTCIKWLDEQGCINTEKSIKDNVVINKYKIFYMDDLELKDECECYVYIHTYMPTNEVLYVGKGTGNRAHDLKSRNIEYKNFINSIKKEDIGVKIIRVFKDNIEAFEYEKEVTCHYKNKGQAKYNKVIGNKAI